jgi:hypothetical protein
MPPPPRLPASAAATVCLRRCGCLPLQRRQPATATAAAAGQASAPPRRRRPASAGPVPHQGNASDRRSTGGSRLAGAPHSSVRPAVARVCVCVGDDGLRDRRRRRLHGLACTLRSANTAAACAALCQSVGLGGACTTRRVASCARMCIPLCAYVGTLGRGQERKAKGKGHQEAERGAGERTGGGAGERIGEGKGGTAETETKAGRELEWRRNGPKGRNREARGVGGVGWGGEGLPAPAAISGGGGGGNSSSCSPCTRTDRLRHPASIKVSRPPDFFAREQASLCTRASSPLPASIRRLLSPAAKGSRPRRDSADARQRNSAGGRNNRGRESRRARVEGIKAS